MPKWQIFLGEPTTMCKRSKKYLIFERKKTQDQAEKSTKPKRADMNQSASLFEFLGQFALLKSSPLPVPGTWCFVLSTGCSLHTISAPLSLNGSLSAERIRHRSNNF